MTRLLVFCNPDVLPFHTRKWARQAQAGCGDCPQVTFKGSGPVGWVATGDGPSSEPSCLRHSRPQSIIALCEEKLQLTSSCRVCRSLSAVGRRVLSIESFGALQGELLNPHTCILVCPHIPVYHVYTRAHAAHACTHTCTHPCTHMPHTSMHTPMHRHTTHTDTLHTHPCTHTLHIPLHTDTCCTHTYCTHTHAHTHAIHTHTHTHSYTPMHTRTHPLMHSYRSHALVYSHSHTQAFK